MRKLSPILDVTSTASILGEARSSLLVLAHKAKERRPLLPLITVNLCPDFLRYMMSMDKNWHRYILEQIAIREARLADISNGGATEGDCSLQPINENAAQEVRSLRESLQTLRRLIAESKIA